MGCAASSIDNEEKVSVCRQRKRLMKKLLGFRGEFADAQLAYLRALRNTGVTLRQFTESETLELENTSYGLSLPLPPSPPPTLPPSPPPPPPFSPDLRKPETSLKNELVDDEDENAAEIDGSGATPPPPLPPWNFWNPFESLEMNNHPNGDNVVTQIGMKKKQQIQQVEEENWAETKSQFEEEDEQQEAGSNCLDLSVQQIETVGSCHMKKPRRLKFRLGEVTDDNSSMTSWSGKDLEHTGVTDCRIRRTLEGIIRELDDYFLKASGCEKEIAVIVDINSKDTIDPFRYQETRRKKSSSAKVFSALSWSWSSKSLGKDTTTSGAVEPCRPGAHCSTLEKLYTAEKKLYQLVRNKEIAKVEHERKSALLQKQDGETSDLSKMEKTRLSLESLKTEIQRLEDSITTTCSCVLNLINDELYPQLVALTSGLAHMWKTMLKCHQVQMHISQQLNHLPDYPNIDLSSEYKRQAVTQLETEVTCWYNSFCKLVNSQREYVKTLCTWIQLTDCLSIEDNQRSSLPVAARKLCKEWQLVFEKLPDEVTSEAIKSFLMAIKSVIHQQAEEYNLRRKCNKLEKRLEKELISLAEMEIKLEGISAMEEEVSSSMSLGSKHPLSIKQAKIEALRRRVDIEKAKYLNSVEVSKRMTLENLKSSLPNVFQVLTALANVFANGFESVHGQTGTDVSDTSQNSDESHS
ncbi:Protein ALTERED PHOSPHATE STARVATION RESPONSE 1 [Cardamine amara subsp. amara]|uniref:Protein ALTERED PHOSPHATE STARVATION RESPONSE 1 n=1 Tax=Cardamine amara subsp. amara TaxID=228776 RepID=A0ABD0Z953_CARAN